MVRAPVSQAVNEPRIAMKVEDDRFVAGEQAVEVAIGHAMWMLSLGLQLK